MVKNMSIAVVAAIAALAQPAAQSQTIQVPLAYAAPTDGAPKPNFSPKGMQVTLTDVPAGTTLPPGAQLPAKTGAMLLGPDATSHVPVLAAATAEFPKDLCLLFVDKNRNGNFADDGPALTATPTQNAKTKAWWTSMNKVEVSVPYATTGATEPYFVNFWIVREDDKPAPDVLRFSVGSWRTGSATVRGVPVLVAAMDADNNALFDKEDMWSVLEASAPDAAKNVLSINEARSTNRFMFVEGPKEQVLEFRGFSPDGRSIDFAVTDKPMTKANDRRADDTVREERARPRASVPFTWQHAGAAYAAALSAAKTSKKAVFIDFETTWCGPCKSMDEWIWTDAEVAGALSAGFLGVKLDGDIEKALVKKYNVAGYPTMIVVDAAGKELARAVGYQSSKEVLAMLTKISSNAARFFSPPTGG